jgi:hypothetical protein
MKFARRVAIQITISLVGCCLASAQGRPIDWPSYNGDAQRTGWEKVDTRITKDNVKDFQLVLKRKLENGPGGPYSLTPPVVIGLLISYRGFKELGFVAGSSGNMWAIDVDVDRIFWQKNIDADSKAKPGCAGGVRPTPALIPPINFGVRPRPGAGGAPNGAAPAPTPTPPTPTPTGVAPAAPGAPPARVTGRGMIGATGFGAPRPAFGVSSDGKLHLMNTSTGEDISPAMNFLPANAIASSLTVVEGTVYTTATDCENGRSGVWAADLGGPDKKPGPVASFALKGGSISRHGGLAMGTDGTVFVQTGPGPTDPASNKWSNTLLALSAKKLKLANYFTVAEPRPGASSITPVVFSFKEKELVVSAGTDGRLYLLDAKNPGGDDHKTPLDQTPQLTAADGGIWGGLSSWQDTTGTRWILAPVWGAVNPELKLPDDNGAAPNGSIVAFKLEDRGGKLALTPAWVSRDIHSPEQPVVTSDVVFALSAGDYGRDEHPKSSTPAVLYALDATTGKEMYSTGNQVPAPANLTGVTLANGRVFFTTTDGTLYGFGVYLER